MRLKTSLLIAGDMCMLFLTPGIVPFLFLSLKQWLPPLPRVQAILCYPKRESKHMTRKEVIGFGDFASLAITG